jgi:hypothetical protein
MLSEWTAECAADAPTLVVPWHDAESGVRFVDLRAEPYEIAEIAEAEHNPTLARALRSLNATRSPFLTAKCDTWQITSADSQGGKHRHADDQDDPSDTLSRLRLELMLDEQDALFGYASYIDLLWRERSVFASAHQQQDRLDRIVRRAQRLEHPEAALECVLRPAMLDLSGPLEGFSVSVYVTAIGPETEIARRRWELALDDVVALLRSKELEPARGSATIDAMDAYPLRARHLGE